MKVTKETVQEAAGKVWQVLAKKGKVNVAELPKLLKEKIHIAFQALGWLAREDKVVYSEKDRKNYVSLTEAEQETARQVGAVR
jgi:Mn-dependent DtxR family transcriptional regulator